MKPRFLFFTLVNKISFLKKINLTQTYIAALLFLFVFCTDDSKQEFVLNATDFQKTIDGKATDLYLLKNDQINQHE